MSVGKVDIHTHFIPKELPNFSAKFGYEGFLRFELTGPCRGRMLWSDGRPMREVSENVWDAGVRLEECDRYGVDLQVVSPVPALFNYFARPADAHYVCQYVNDQLATLVQSNPTRMKGLGHIPMQAPMLAVKEAKRLREMGFVGVQLGTNITDKNLSEAEFFPVYEALESLGLSLFIHPWDMMGSQSMQKYWLPWLVGMPAEESRAICSLIFGGVFQKFPKLRVAIAHGGGSFVGTFGRIEQGFRARPDLCAIDDPSGPKAYLGKFFVDSLVFSPEMLRLAIGLYGEDRICLGTDYPFPLGEERPGELIEKTDLSPLVKERLLRGNALEWMRAL